MAYTVVYTDNPKGNLEIEREILSEIDAELVNGVDHPDPIPELIADADAVIVSHFPMDADAIAGLSDCQVICRTGIGVDNVDIGAATERGILVTNVPDYCIPEVSDHVFALLLALQRNVVYFSGEMEEGCWEIEPLLEPRRLSELSLGLVALGSVARAVAEKAAAFGMDVAAYDPYLSEAEISGHGVTPETDLDALLADSDVVSVHAPLTEETEHLIGREQLRTMRDSAVLLNTSRGGLIDEEALERALRDGELAGAGLDVFENEPDPSETLLELDRVVTTPHIAFKSRESVIEQRRTIAWNVRRVLEGSTPENVVNAELLEGG